VAAHNKPREITSPHVRPFHLQEYSMNWPLQTHGQDVVNLSEQNTPLSKGPKQRRQSVRFGGEKSVSPLPGLQHRTIRIFKFLNSFFFFNYSGSLHVDMLVMIAVKTTNDKMF